jgi:hypothetical protein
MKNRDYYERLISDSLDRPLSEVEVEELEKALQESPELAEFKAGLIRQAALARSLPELSTSVALKLPCARRDRNGIIWSLWNVRLSVPVPVAAILALVVVGSVLFGTHTRPVPEKPPVMRQAVSIEYVQVERMKPVKAVLIEQNPKENERDKEEL